MFKDCNKLKYLNLLNFSINCNKEDMLLFKKNKDFLLVTNNNDLLKLYKSS